MEEEGKKTLEELHRAAYETLDREDNFNYGDDVVQVHWKPVARDIEFDKHIAKLKAMREFNRRRNSYER